MSFRISEIFFFLAGLAVLFSLPLLTTKEGILIWWSARPLYFVGLAFFGLVFFLVKK